MDGCFEGAIGYVKIAIIGCGVVGGGVLKLIEGLQCGITVKRVLDRAPLPSIEDMYTDNIADIINDGEIDAVVECIGGIHPALSFVQASLCAGKHVVTSNKEMVSHAYANLLATAAEHNVQMRFSASVGGGVPWLHNLQRIKRGDRILSLSGIANGTTNYILDAMARGETFEAALAAAQQLGYAEADPTADLMGLDVQRKCAISASVAFDAAIPPDRIPVLGIAGITQRDVAFFASRGLTCKLLMHADRADAGIVAYVEPTLLSQDSLEAHTPTNHNLISLCAQMSGALSFFGQGAGRFPTAQNMVQDLLDIHTRNYTRIHKLAPLSVCCDAELHPYYIRTSQENAVPQDAIDQRVEGDVFITKAITVERAHALAAALYAIDAAAFVAGIPGMAI